MLVLSVWHRVVAPVLEGVVKIPRQVIDELRYIANKSFEIRSSGEIGGGLDEPKRSDSDMAAASCWR